MNAILAPIRRWVLKRLERPARGYQQRIVNNPDKLFKVIRPGDVLLVEGRSEMSRIINWLSRSRWSHAALYVGDALIAPDYRDRERYLSRYGRDAVHMLVEAFSGEGVIASPTRRYTDYNIRICRPYGIRTPDLQRVIEQVIGRLGDHYDDQNVIDLAWIFLRSLLGFKNKHTIRACLGNCNDYQVICSGMIARAFQSVGYPIVPALAGPYRNAVFTAGHPYGAGVVMRHYTQIIPTDFDLSPNFEIIKFNIIGMSGFDYKSLWVEGFEDGSP